MLKVGGGLSSPVPVKRGDKTGLSTFWTTYSLAIEPY